jgi:DNA-binding beta-propeller fold protein YncE
MRKVAILEELFVELGERRYRVQRPFGELGTDLAGATVSDVAVDRRGHVFVLVRRDSQKQETGPAVIELSSTGERLAAWGEGILDAHMLLISDDDRIYVVDRDAHEVRVYGLSGTLTHRLGRRGEPGRPFNHPTDVAVMPDGRVVVADGYGNARIHVFSAEGNLLTSFGDLGVEPGRFVLPHAVWPVGEHEVVVADRENHRVQHFNLDGSLLGVWTGFFRPQDIWGDGKGHLFVTDSIPSLAMVSEYGERLGRCRPVLNGAHGISGDRANGRLYLAETNPSRITCLIPVLE